MRSTSSVVVRRMVILFATLGAAVALAQTPTLPGTGSPVQPRVFVILDTSLSMSHRPDYNSNFWDDATVVNDDTSSDPKNSPVPDANCRSKFCIAKKTVYSVLRGYLQDDIRLSLASYYQYLIKYDPVDTRQTRCWYDVMWKANQTLYYPKDGSYAFNEDTRLGTLTNFDLAGAPLVAGVQMSNQQLCVSNAASKYNLTEENTPNPMPSVCTIYDRTSNPSPSVTTSGAVPTQTGCVTSKSYSVAAYLSNDNKGGGYYRYRIPAASTCPAAVPVSANYTAPVPAAASTITVDTTQNNAVCAGSASGCWETANKPWTSVVADSCTTGYPCKMYSASPGGEAAVLTKSEWIGYFGGDCTLSPQPTAAAGSDSASNTAKCALISGTNATNFYTTGRLSPSPATLTYTDTGNTNNCNALTLTVPTRKTTGALAGANGYAAATAGALATAVTAAVGAVTGGYTLATPPQTACSAGWPCDVTLTANTTNAVSWGGWGTAQNACTPVAGSVQCQSTTAKAAKLLMTGGSCPSFTTSTANPVAGTAAGDWTIAPNLSPGCGTGNAACTFLTGPTTTAGTIPSCAATVTNYASTAPASCTLGSLTRAYAGVAGSPVSVWVDQTRLPSTCTATLANASFQAAAGADTTALNTCRLGTCSLTGGSPSLSSAKEYVSSTTSTSMPAGGWAPVVTSACAGDNCSGDVATGGSLWIVPVDASGCSGYTPGAVTTVGGSLGKFVLGAYATGASINGYNADSTPRYQCKFAAFTRVWERYMTRCAYSITPRTWTANNAVTWCGYTIAQQQQKNVNATTYTCTYKTAVRKFDLTLPQYKVCNYYRTASTLNRNLTLYRYSYQTKGGELVGSSSVSLASNQCDGAVPYASFSSTCPVTVDACKGAATACYLRTTTNAAPTFSAAPSSQATAGRFVNVAGGGNFSVTENGGNASYNSNNLGFTAGRACGIDVFTPAPSAEPARAAYCANNGAGLPVAKYKLVSDYLSCSDPSDPSTCAANAIASITNDHARAPELSLEPGYALNLAGSYVTPTASSWTNAATKAYAMSGSGTGYTTPSQLFLPFPADNVDNTTDFTTMLSGCSRPSTSNVTWPNWSHQGLCMADTGSVNTATCNGGDVCSDFTPLYGSLSNAYDYLKGQLAADGNGACRKYVVVLATDGAENTPANYTPAQLNAAVTKLRTLTGGATTTDVKTYVLGFGDLVSDATNAAHLNDMALAGGTANAYFASNQAALQTQLNAVFSSILQGTYSRSKPVIATDGKTVYASYFTRGNQATSPEWVGTMTAWGISSSGSLSYRWELGDKLNNQMTDSDRTLYTDVSGVRQDFTVANGTTLKPLLNTDSQYPGGPGTTATLDPLRVLKFVRNTAKVTGSPGTGEAYYLSTATQKRTSRLNAIVQSAPTPVGTSVNPPDWGGPTGSTSRTSYATFQLATASRETRVLVGASDGILRGVRESVDTAAHPVCTTDEANAACPNGMESWGWVPSIKHPTLYKQLSGYSPGIDGQPAVEDVCAQDNGNGDAKNCASANWKTIAVTGLRSGGRGVFALDITNPADPKFLWEFDKSPSQDQLGYPQSPIIGRVELSGKDNYATVIASGTRWNGIDGDLSQANSDEIYVLNALTGDQIDWYNACGHCGAGFNELDMTDQVWNEDNQFIARPAYFRRQGSPYMDSVMLSGTAGVLFEMRFRHPPTVTVSGGVTTVTSNAETNTSKWEPQVFFDPTSGATSKDPLNHQVKVRRVVEADAGVYDLEECAGLTGGSTCGALPLSRRLPIFVRPRLSTVYDSSGLAADYYVGTGDGRHSDNPDSDFTYNYFYAVHDGSSAHNGKHDGQPLWVNQFIDPREQVISEPAMVSGSLIVGTYLPPPAGTQCDNAGDVTFYCFDPKVGDLRSCLVAADGTKTGVMKFPNVGIPSDPVVVNQTMYWMSSSSATGPAPTDPSLGPTPNTQGVAPVISLGDTRSFRRVR